MARIWNKRKQTNTTLKKKVFVAMSGGVDSSVSALLLKKRGYDVVGVFMRCFNVDGCQDRDAEDARRVAEYLGIPFYVWDFEDEYKRKIVDYMVEGYRNGITPNPDVMCNKEIKFGLFLDRALKMGADFVATGHYVRVRELKNQKSKIKTRGLFAAKDKNKDQSYFLWALDAKLLPRCLFPMGDYLKSEVRAMAGAAGLPTAKKKDSQGICFLGKVSLVDFLKRYLPEKRGLVITDTGRKIGSHDGSYFYTIGQRHGLDLKSKNKELGARGKRTTRPHYVAEKNIKTNTIIVAEGADNQLLFKREIELADLNLLGSWNNAGVYKKEKKVFARVRYRQPLSAARFYRGDNDMRIARLAFDLPQKFVAAGQSAVFYSKSGEMLGGGIIL